MESTPPTFRMYTTGDIFDALGEEVMLRFRDKHAAEPFSAEDGTTVGQSALGFDENCRYSSPSSPPSSCSRPRRVRQIASLVEIQVAWVGGCTQLLAWLDFMQM